MMLRRLHKTADGIEQTGILLQPVHFPYVPVVVIVGDSILPSRHQARQCLQGLRCQQGEILLQFLRRAALHIIQRFVHFVCAETLRRAHFRGEAAEFFGRHVCLKLLVPRMLRTVVAEQSAQIQHPYRDACQFLCGLSLLWCRCGCGFRVRCQCTE